MNFIYRLSILILLFLTFSLTNNIYGEKINWKELIKAKNFYESGLCEFTRYHLTLDKKHLAEAITLFKDGIAIDPNFSKAYYALVSSLEEYEPGSSQIIGDNLRELLDNMYDPFTTGRVAAYEIGSIELLGVCMERIRILESALTYGKKTGIKLNKSIYEKFSCPCGGKYSIKDGKNGVIVKCSIHSSPLDRNYLKDDYSKTIKRFNSKSFKIYLEAMDLYRKSTLPNSKNIEKLRKKATHLFLKSIKLNDKLIESYIGYMNLAHYGRLNSKEYAQFTQKYKKLVKDKKLKRYGRLTAGDFIDIEYKTACSISKMMINSGIKMYLLNKGKIDPSKLDLNVLVKKGYLKHFPFCKLGGEYKIRKKGKEFEVYCTKHDK